mmetsp:Transcript_55802/g.86665  ORF Transcript_55802/g.86665 Transcript_55802/m.86665 type:complete len:680 (+) Transcript_55802:22-2061(+)
MSKVGRSAALKASLAKVEAAPGRPEFGVSSALPALSVCRLEAPEDLLRKLRQHVDDPALADFTCPICWDPFWQPVRTVCGHAFCEGCLLKAVLAQLNHQQPDVSCPLCRHPLHVDDVAVDQALLTRIRLALTEKDKESVSCPRRSSGRVHRGLVAAVHGASGTSSANVHPSSSSTSAPSCGVHRPRTREGAIFSDLDGLAVLAGPTLSGSNGPSQGQSSRVQTPYRGVPLRGPPRTAPTAARGNDEGSDDFFPNAWLRVSASSPCGNRPSSKGRPGTSPAAPISAREASAFPQRSPSTAPEEELGSLAMGTPRRHEAKKCSTTSRLGVRACSFIGGGGTQGDSASRPSTSGLSSPPVRRCGWGPVPPPVAKNQAQVAIEVPSGGNASDHAAGGLRSSRPIRHRRKITRATASESTTGPSPANGASQAAKASNGTTPLESAQVSLATAETVCTSEAEAEPFDQSVIDIDAQTAARLNATAWAEVPIPAISLASNDSASPARHAHVPTSPSQTQAVPLPSVIRSPPVGAPPPLSISISDARATTPGIARLDEIGSISATSQMSQQAASQSRNARTSANSCGNAIVGRQPVLQTRREPVGGTHAGGTDNTGLVSRFLNSAAGALSAAVGWSTHTLPVERGRQRLGQHSGFGPSLEPACNQNANYAADFAFADRYRQLLEEGV